jgi:glycerol-3-phosphate dehydrogenase (NAD(P)+)
MGNLVARGMSTETIIQQLGQIPESPNTIRSLFQLMEQQQLNLPLLDAAYGVLYQNKQYKDALDELFYGNASA